MFTIETSIFGEAQKLVQVVKTALCIGAMAPPEGCCADLYFSKAVRGLSAILVPRVCFPVFLFFSGENQEKTGGRAGKKNPLIRTFNGVSKKK